MKNIKIVIVSILMLLGCVTIANAQKHRHTERNDSAETEIIKKSNVTRTITITEDGRNDTTYVDLDDYMGEDIEELAERFEEHVERWANSFEHGTPNMFGSLLGGTITICAMIFAFLVLLLVFGLPIIIIVGIFWLIWLLVRPSKKEKKEQATDPSIVTINAEPQDEALVKRKIAKKEPKGRNKKMEKAIMNIFVGMGLFFASLIIQMQLLTAISAFLIFFGVGELVIAKFLNKDDEKSE